MGTLASELSPHVDRTTSMPRVYVDANVPQRIVTAMRNLLHWDAWFVIEHEDLRRATDGAHFRLARQLRRTLITLDHDYLDGQRFPVAESGGVLVLSAPDEDGLMRILRRVDRELLRGTDREHGAGLPLEGRTLHLQAEWAGAERPPRERRSSRAGSRR